MSRIAVKHAIAPSEMLFGIAPAANLPDKPCRVDDPGYMSRNEHI